MVQDRAALKIFPPWKACQVSQVVEERLVQLQRLHKLEIPSLDLARPSQIPSLDLARPSQT